MSHIVDCCNSPLLTMTMPIKYISPICQGKIVILVWEDMGGSVGTVPSMKNTEMILLV